ncbi:MAG: ATP-binding protein [Acidobacteriota bacterium]|nr:ATP-binding protein [Acidobacteriota bacterium]
MVTARERQTAANPSHSPAEPWRVAVLTSQAGLYNRITESLGAFKVEGRTVELIDWRHNNFPLTERIPLLLLLPEDRWDALELLTRLRGDRQQTRIVLILELLEDAPTELQLMELGVNDIRLVEEIMPMVIRNLVCANLSLIHAVREREDACRLLKRLEGQVLALSHKAGMAELAAGVLHNVGNLLNGITTSAEAIKHITKHSQVEKLSKANMLLEEHKDNAAHYLTHDERGKMLPKFLQALEKSLSRENVKLTRESYVVQRNARTIDQIIKTQQACVSIDEEDRRSDLNEVIRHTLTLMNGCLRQHQVQVEQREDFKGRLMVSHSKAVQVVSNLIQNALDALMDNPADNRHIEVITEAGKDKIRVVVTDNGSGMTPEQTANLFRFGYTTKSKGHGFGLHSSLHFMRQMGGDLQGSSEGAGKGATFTMTFQKRPVI